MVEFIPNNLNIPFLDYGRKCATVSAILVGTSLLLLAVVGLPLGVDFAGGTELQVKFESADVTTANIRQALAGLKAEPEVQYFGQSHGKNEYLLKTTQVTMIDSETASAIGKDLLAKLAEFGPRNFAHRTYGGDHLEFTADKKIEEAKIREALTGRNLNIRSVTIDGAEGRWLHQISMAGLTDEVSEALTKAFGANSFTVVREETVGPKVGAQLVQDGTLSIIACLIAILIYVGFRFDFKFSAGAVVALFHDALITIGLFVVLQRPFNIATIAALLTIIGYSINDTIVVFDRIRERIPIDRDLKLHKIVDNAINQTLSRTTLTSMITLVSVICLLLLGGGIIYDFSLAMFIGILVGTYSSIYVAGSLALALGLSRKDLLPAAKQAVDDRP